MPLVVGVRQTLGQRRRLLGLNLGKPAVSCALLNVMWIVAFGANEPAFLAVARPFADALAVNAFSPVAKNRAMALPAQLLRLVEADRIHAAKPGHPPAGLVVRSQREDGIFPLSNFFQ